MSVYWIQSRAIDVRDAVGHETEIGPVQFDRTFKTRPGEVATLPGDIRRITADNPGIMTFTGTNTYLVGTDPVAIIDPGPDDGAHLDALLAAIGTAQVAAIVVTHTHRDHSPLARALKARTGARIVGAGPHRFARTPQDGDAALDGAVDGDHSPDQILSDGERIAVGDLWLETVATPGHTMNHLCFALAGQRDDPAILFSGDHVMAWSTTLVAPPDGAMTAYLKSLQTLLDRPETLYLPAHGTLIHDAHVHVRALFDHRMGRETAILSALEIDGLTIYALVDRLYEALSPDLRRAAGLSVLAHLERLETLNLARREHSDRSLTDTIWRAGPLAFDRAD